ncbi:MAG: DUF4783 domain-containing protein [Bacteroidales bacterium]|nr:DUF4783 domain-containing protein [Candidatus Hennigimonas equi]
MKRIYALIVSTVLAAGVCLAQSTVRTSLSSEPLMQDSSYDVFIPIGKYLAAGDAESLSAWFAPTLEVSVLGTASDCSKTQAKQIMKAFFKSYAPRSFSINHQAGRENQKYALGNLSAGGEHFIVTIFVSCPSEGSFRIQLLKIDRL